MPRYTGQSHGYTYPARTLLDKEAFDDMEACRTSRGENQAEFVRAAILFFIITKCSPKSTDSTIQPVGGTQP